MVHHRSGSVRSIEAREAILAATAELFAVNGYDHLTIEGIAAQAGVGKQTIYRWWPARASLIADCLLEGRIFQSRLAVPNTGDVLRDVTDWVTTIFATADAPGNHALLRSLIAAAADDAAVGTRLHDSLTADGSLTKRLSAAQDAGQLAPDAPLESIGEALLGAVVLRALSRKETDAGVVARLVDVSIGRLVGNA